MSDEVFLVRHGETVHNAGGIAQGWSDSALSDRGNAQVRALALSLTYCKSADSATPRCEAERTREFAAARNAEIDASIAAVVAQREAKQN